MTDVNDEVGFGGQLTVLTSAGPLLTKRWAADGSVVASQNAWQMRPSTMRARNIDELHDALKALASAPRSAVIRGRYVGGETSRQLAHDAMRRHNASRASRGQSPVKLHEGFVPRVGELFVDQVTPWLMLDVDNYFCADLEPCSDPSAACREFISIHLPEPFWDRSFVYQLSASAGHASTDRRRLKAHLWFMLEEPGFTCAQLRAWALSIPAVDASVLSPTQLHYTAAPELDGGVIDPIAGRRLGLVKGPAGDAVPLVIEPGVLARARVPRGRINLSDPRDKPGIVGAYCRAVDCDALDQRHPDLFESGRDARHFTWRDAPSNGADGVFVTDDGLHLVCVHSSAPTEQNRAVNAYDFDRLFMFGDLDAEVAPDCAMRDRPSVHAMRDWIAEHHPEVLDDIEYGSSAEIDFGGLDDDEAESTSTEGHAAESPLTRPPEESTSRPTTAATARPALRIWSPEDLRNREPARWLIQGWVAERGICVLYGDSNIGKSFIALGMGLCISLGRPWHGIKVQQGAVVYVAAEGGHGFGRRFDAYESYHDVDLGDAPIGLVDEGLDLRTSTSDADRVIAACREFERTRGRPVRMVVLDTLARMMTGGNENSPDDMGKLIANAGRICDALNALVLLVHHCGKDESRGARGHSSLRAAADTEIQARIEGSEIRVLELTKQRDGPRDLRVAFKLESVEVGIDPDGGPPITSALAVPVDTPAKRALREKALSPWQQYVVAAIDEAKGFDDDPPTAAAVRLEAERIIRDAKGGSLPDRWDFQFERAAQGLLSAGRIKLEGDRYMRT